MVIWIYKVGVWIQIFRRTKASFEGRYGWGPKLFLFSICCSNFDPSFMLVSQFALFCFIFTLTKQCYLHRDVLNNFEVNYYEEAIR